MQLLVILSAIWGYDAAKKKTQSTFFPHYVQLSSCLQVLFIRKAACLGNKPKNNVSINASKETCVANGFSETIGSERVTLPLHRAGLIFLSMWTIWRALQNFTSESGLRCFETGCYYSNIITWMAIRKYKDKKKKSRCNFRKCVCHFHGGQAHIQGSKRASMVINIKDDFEENYACRWGSH